MTCSGLSKLNSELSRHRLARYLTLAVFSLSFVTYLGYSAIKFGLNVPPWAIGDEPSYDSIGWELSRGNGFAENFRDPKFRFPYEQAARKDPAFPRLPDPPGGPTTIRPPLFPVLIAATDLLFGRQFWAVRLANIFAVSATCGLLSYALFQLAGLFPALIGAFLYVVVDFHTRLYARAIMSEAIASLFIAIVVLALFNYVGSQKKHWLVTAALAFGFAVLSRNIFFLWLPGMAILLFFLLQAKLRVAIRSVLLFLSLTLLVVSPWMVRNCLVLKSFKPMGTQGMSQLAAGYSEIAWKHQGVWQNLDRYNFFDAAITDEMTSLEKELAKANYSRRKAFEWVQRNPLRAIALVPLKIYHEYRPHTKSDAVIFLLALCGLFTMRKSVEGKILLGFLLINMFAVAVTWSVSGRFLVPLIFVIHLAAAMGGWAILLRSCSLFSNRETERK